MLNEKIYKTRIERFRDEVEKHIYVNNIPLQAEYIYDQENPIPYVKELEFSEQKTIISGNKEYSFREINQREEWGKTWGSAWFRFSGKIPADWKCKEVGALIDLEAEGCLFKDGTPWQGLTNKIHWNINSAKRLIIMSPQPQSGKKISLLVEAAANGLFGAGQEFYRLQQAELCCLNRKAWVLYYDLVTLVSLVDKLALRSPRRQKILRQLNDAADLFQDGKGIKAALKITAGLLKKPAAASSLIAYSIGHAHLDLGWLWPIRETRRKAGRTFSTALRFMEEYPEYRFGASQPQLYEWVKEDYPELYNRIKEAVKQEKWECQGAMWVEADMNITGGESLVRQCFYGKQWWQQEFGLDIRNLWLPDVFGYSAALPQILKKCGVDFFMTQKISWNESNTFPHHTFYWEGIDGTRLASHFLPANDYNCSNLPRQMIEAEERFAQNDVADDFLNLYGIGDGGGGPSRIHIELGKRQQNTEGAPRFNFALARDFFKTVTKLPAEKLPIWKGELYLELHRGTYTTQAKMKKYNRLLEHRLRDVEILSAFTNSYDQKLIDRIWKNTLLNQFHDILPGSSIKWVYDDAHTFSQNNLLLLQEYQKKLLQKFCNEVSTDKYEYYYLIFNTLSWQRNELIDLELPDEEENWQAYDYLDNELASYIKGDIMQVRIVVPSLGYTIIRLQKTEVAQKCTETLNAEHNLLENSLLRVEFNEQGEIESIYDKELQREMLAEKANTFLLYEDKPNNWDAWDINHFYREAEPEQAKLISAHVVHKSSLSAVIEQEFTVSDSSITQYISLNSEEKLIRCWNRVDWQEKHKMLRLRAAVNIKADYAACEIQYGLLKRANHSNNSWDAAQFEVCCHRFADLSQDNCGFALLNDCKYGYYLKGNLMELNLLRSPTSPDATADRGEHIFGFGYLPHSGNLINSRVLQEAHAFNNDLIIQRINKVPESKNYSWFKIKGDNVKIEVIKPAADGNGIILRLYEYYGCESRIHLGCAEQWLELRETDLLENDLHLLNKRSSTAELDFTPFEIRTFRLIMPGQFVNPE